MPSHTIPYSHRSTRPRRLPSSASSQNLIHTIPRHATPYQTIPHHTATYPHHTIPPRTLPSRASSGSARCTSSSEPEVDAMVRRRRLTPISDGQLQSDRHTKRKTNTFGTPRPCRFSPKKNTGNRERGNPTGLKTRYNFCHDFPPTNADRLGHSRHVYVDYATSSAAHCSEQASQCLMWRSIQPVYRMGSIELTRMHATPAESI